MFPLSVGSLPVLGLFGVIDVLVRKSLPVPVSALSAPSSFSGVCFTGSSSIYFELSFVLDER